MRAGWSVTVAAAGTAIIIMNIHLGVVFTTSLLIVFYGH